MRDADAAHRWYEKSASAGCAEGCLGFALSLARRGKRENRVRIAEEVRRAADAGLPTATYLLAVLTEHGLGVTRDMAAAAQLYQAAAENGLPSAQFRLGLALIDGALVDQDVAAGEAWDATCRLGRQYRGSPSPGQSLCENAAAGFCRSRKLVSASGRGGPPGRRPRFGLALFDGKRRSPGRRREHAGCALRQMAAIRRHRSILPILSSQEPESRMTVLALPDGSKRPLHRAI
ncbi:hypothetical protein [Mesorhizobium sp. B2-4-17]|uniref:tetratricopeptide repeat protein n=1 Tax=Mesorhizobium sp. B2-4-17 TaxID=2589932 RepID=UPI001FEFD4F5|nr:hypothetical protein [Mesorhizobium sp. B2-4-17]